ncbi:hypothetical protein GCM10009613_49320 [Pseudonocardia kongjuensis]|uniref:Uncharacterized protein n=1 Tax=Pseudonocardia kongjuensis TaxID=102227 RepID=A0ABN1Y3Q0_9PSEU
MPGNDPVAAGVTIFLAIALGPAVLVGLLVRAPALVRRVVALRRRSRPAPPVPVGPPLERLVADLRRLDRLRRGPPPSTRLRRVALLAAYDDVLLAACRATGVEDPPLRAWVDAGGTAGALDAGRDLARLRTEAALEATGVRIDPPGPAAA